MKNTFQLRRERSTEPPSKRNCEPFFGTIHDLRRKKLACHGFKDILRSTPVEFEFKGIGESLNGIKLPMEYSRNIPMIFKELPNNILKHSHATNRRCCARPCERFLA